MVSSRKSQSSGGSGAFRASNLVVTVELQLEEVERLLCDEMALYCDDIALLRQTKRQFRGMSERPVDELSWNEISEIIERFRAMLNSSPKIPRNTVAQVHSCIGLLQNQRAEYESAISAFLKTLWIETAQREPDGESIGITVNRLGIAHGRNENYVEAVALLQKARTIYTAVGYRDEHPFQVNINEEIQTLRRRQSRQAGSSLGVKSIPILHSLREGLQQIDRRLSL